MLRLLFAKFVTCGKSKDSRSLEESGARAAIPSAITATAAAAPTARTRA